jgi:hypothetical protein
LKSPFPIERWNACIQLGNIRARNTSSIAALKNCLMDKDFYVRKCSLIALGKSLDKQFVPDVVRMLFDNSWIVQIAAMKVLAEIGDLTIIPNIENFKNSHEAEIRSLVPVIVNRIKRKSKIFNEIYLCFYSKLVLPIKGFFVSLIILR